MKLAAQAQFYFTETFILFDFPVIIQYRNIHYNTAAAAR
jgi:hypothetical protein